MSYKGIIFDFNGTLYWDSAMHKQAWRLYSKKLRGTEFTDEEMLHHMFGRTNEEIIEYAIGKKPDSSLVDKCAKEKEELYRLMSMQDKKNFHLAKGAENLLNFLKENNIPRNIATMSEKDNVDFYFSSFNLNKWFDRSKVAYANGKIPGKPAPDVYELAAKNINLLTKDCIVVEDAISGIESARRAGIGKIIAICSEEPPEFYKNISGVNTIIHDFDELDRSLFDIKSFS